MRILLIGNTSLQNDAIKKILLSQDGWKVLQVPPTEIAEEEPDFKKNHFSLSIIDLCSLTQNVKSFVKNIRNAGLATYLLIMYDDHSEYLLQKLLKTGADGCVSVNSKTEQFMGAISKFSNS